MKCRKLKNKIKRSALLNKAYGVGYCYDTNGRTIVDFYPNMLGKVVFKNVITGTEQMLAKGLVAGNRFDLTYSIDTDSSYATQYILIENILTHERNEFQLDKQDEENYIYAIVDFFC